MVALLVILLVPLIVFLVRYNEPKLKTARYWEIDSIYIDGSVPTENWETTAATYEWCSGSGTENDPFIIENVTINGQKSGNCIYIGYSAAFFIIRNCTIYNSADLYGDGIYLNYVSNGNIIYNNCSFNGDNGIFFQGRGNNNNISHNKILNNRRAGIDLESFYDNCIISNNIISDNGQNGIVLIQDCDNNTIRDNFIYNSGSNGILLQGGSDNNIVKDNRVFSSDSGIKIYTNSNNNTIERNNVSNCYNSGIHIEHSQSNTVKNNVIIDNDGDGVRFKSWVNYNNTNNIISENFIKGNLGRGVSIDIYSFSNLIYQNEFINNTINAEDNGIDNKWDNGTIGNYWDDYGGVDANDDGIGDTPYNITGSANSVDHYPIWDDGYEDYNWIETAFEGLSKGSGTWNDPYIIKNLVINLRIHSTLKLKEKRVFSKSFYEASLCS